MSETAHRLGALNVGTLEAKLCDSVVVFANTPRGVRINDQRVMVSKFMTGCPWIVAASIRACSSTFYNTLRMIC
jgi:hypothetical protein